MDALRYSLFNNYSTARVSSLGGAFGSLGGNMGSISSNPATLGTYRTDEVSISFVNDNESIQSSYLDQNNTVDRYKLFLQKGLKLARIIDFFCILPHSELRS